MYIPAATNVAEWIRADAGTGASIESGNQAKKGPWADLMHAAVSNKIAIFSFAQ